MMTVFAIFIVFELRRVSTPYLSLSNRTVTSYLQVREANQGTHRYLLPKHSSSSPPKKFQILLFHYSLKYANYFSILVAGALKL